MEIAEPIISVATIEFDGAGAVRPDRTQRPRIDQQRPTHFSRRSQPGRPITQSPARGEWNRYTGADDDVQT